MQGREVAAGEKILSLPETEPLMSQRGKNRIFITTIVGRVPDEIHFHLQFQVN